MEEALVGALGEAALRGAGAHAAGASRERRVGTKGAATDPDSDASPQGFRCAADLQPVLRLDLRGCRVSYKEKRGRRLQHALKVVGTAGEALLLGFPSRQQAEDWRKVWRCCSPAELSAGTGGAALLVAAGLR